MNTRPQHQTADQPSPRGAVTGHLLGSSDVQVWLQPGTPDLVSVGEKEWRLALGEGYAGMISPEAVPGEAMMRAFGQAMARELPRVAQLVAALAARILATQGPEVTLVSLARGGTPVGSMLRRQARHWGLEWPHHTLSVIRGPEGLDLKAFGEISRRAPGALVLVDGWTGKGSVRQSLEVSLARASLRVPPLAVLSDPAGLADLQGTFDDVLIPHALLGATICGGLSRSFVHAGDRPGHDLHRAMVWEGLLGDDVSASYLDAAEDHARVLGPGERPEGGTRPKGPVPRTRAAMQQLSTGHPEHAALLSAGHHHIKPGIGEATRVFLRRAPGLLLLRDPSAPETAHLRRMAAEAGTPALQVPELPYRAVAVIGAAPHSTPGAAGQDPATPERERHEGPKERRA